MGRSIVKGSRQVPSQRGTEWLWGGLGLGTAGLSACFATYMLAFGPAGRGVPSAADFGIFARMQASQRVADTRVLPVLRGAPPLSNGPVGEGTPVVAAAATAIDFAPTGSVAGKPQAGKAKAAVIVPASQTSDKVLSSFILRDVFDGQALVESPSLLTLVSKGSVILGAGKVLSIERRGDRWTVVTSEGIIGEGR